MAGVADNGYGMTPVWIAFLFGLIIGGIVGFIVAIIMALGGR